MGFTVRYKNSRWCLKATIFGRPGEHPTLLLALSSTQMNMVCATVLRILMLITQAWAYRVSVTPPNPPPPKTDQKHHGDTMVLPIYWNRWVWDVRTQLEL